MSIFLTMEHGRTLRFAEKERLQGLWRQYNTFAPKGPDDQSQRPENFRFFQHWPDNWYALLYDTEKSGEAVATLTVVPEVTCLTAAARFKDIIVEKEFRRQGYRKILIEKAMEWWRDRNLLFHYAEIPSHPSRETANKQYEEIGFQLVSQGLALDAPNIYRKLFTET